MFLVNFRTKNEIKAHHLQKKIKKEAKILLFGDWQTVFWWEKRAFKNHIRLEKPLKATFELRAIEKKRVKHKKGEDIEQYIEY